jgi:hypothetical protein
MCVGSARADSCPAIVHANAHNSSTRMHARMYTVVLQQSKLDRGPLHPD